MFNNSTPFTMPVMPATYNYGNGGGLGGGFGSDWIGLIVILALLGWGGNGNGIGGFGGGRQNWATPADLTTQGIIQKLDGQTYGLADSTFALNNTIVNGFHGVDNAICTLGYQMQDCCCQTQRAIDGVNYNMAKGFCDLGNVMNNNTRDIIENQNAGTRAILDFLTTDKIATLQAENQNLRLKASQADQNAVLRAAIDASTAEIIRRTGNDCPVPAYVVNGPTPINFPTNCCGQFTGYGYNNGGCGNF